MSFKSKKRKKFETLKKANIYFKKTKNTVIDKNREEGDNRKQDMTDKGNAAKNFNAILEYKKNDKEITKLINVKNRGKIINLYTVITKFLDAKKTLLK